jgi:SAM-dependent methyltransferase|nr:class I SAM-dependent methyltransferase [Kofleriaceae bacterium]
MPADAIDTVNGTSISGVYSVDASMRRSGLDLPERAALEAIEDTVRGRPILDLGVGGGRTTFDLRELSPDYVAIDYSPEMVAACRARYPDVDVRVGDARDLSQLPSDHFALVLFSCNGLGMLGHADRLRVLAEVRRVLAPAGVFAFSTHNLDARANHRRLALPELELVSNPLRSAVRTLRFARRTVVRAVNRARYRRHEEHHGGWAILNSECLDYGTLLYHVTLAEARRQLAAAGFAGDRVIAYDLSGFAIEAGTTDDSILYLARRA